MKPRTKLQIFAFVLAMSLVAPAVGQDKAEPPADIQFVTPPLKNVILYSSGVGAFVHEGKISGKSRVRFQFDDKQLNDLLKSLFITATGKVSIDSVNYPSKLPLAELLKDSKINIQGASSIPDILRQLRGYDFICKLSGGGEFTGKLAGIEERMETVILNGEKVAQNVVFASFVTPTGLRSIRLSDLADITPKDKAVLDDLAKSLATIAEYGLNTAKNMDIYITSEGENLLRSAYVIESPVWKTSYRLEISENPKDKQAFLQGWALVENPTNTPWKDVSISLVSGRPLSFIQDLYSSIYLSRPVMVRKNYTEIAPVRHEMGAPRSRSKSDIAYEKFEFAADDFEETPMPDSILAGSSSVAKHVTNAQQNVKSGAAGELYKYDIAKPVTLGSRESAMLELIGEKIDIAKKSVYNPTINSERPLNAIELTNSTKLLLPQGPITIFDGNSYGGDASLLDVPAGQKQILSYGVDLEVIAEQSNPKWETGKVATLTLERGNLKAVSKQQLANVYKFSNKSSKDKILIVEHPKMNSGTLVSIAKPIETTPSHYRFELPLGAGKDVELPVTEEKILTRFFDISGVDNSEFYNAAMYVEGGNLSDEAKAFFAKVTADNAKIKDLKQEIADITASMQTTSEAHSRTRDSLRTISSNDYRNKLTEQLAALDKKLFELAQSKEEKIAELRKLEKELNDYIMKAKF